jgi:hypothetical protein
MGAGFRWWSEPMTNDDGTPSLYAGKQRYAHHHVLGEDCDRNADISLNFYWRAHDRCHHWSNSLVPLNERRRRGFTELPPPVTSAPPFEDLGAWEDAFGNSVELIRRGA